MAYTKTITRVAPSGGFRPSWTHLGAGAAAAGYNYYRSRPSGGGGGGGGGFGRGFSSRSSGGGSGRPITSHWDSKTDYTKRRLSKRQRRTRRKRVKRRRRLVNTIRSSNVGTTHIVRRSLGLVTSSAGVSNNVTYGLYGLNGTSFETVNTHNDIGEFFKEMDATSWANVNAPTVAGQNHKIYTMHATAEYTLVNNLDQDVFVEAYHIRGRRGALATAWANPTDMFNNGFNKQATATDPNTGASFDAPLASSQIGVTPFQNTLWCKYFVITKRQKFKIPPLGEVSFVITDRRPRTFSMDHARTYATDRNYMGVLFQQQGLPNAVAGVETPSLNSSVTYMCARRYRLKMFRDNLPKDSFEVTDP